MSNRAAVSEDAGAWPSELRIARCTESTSENSREQARRSFRVAKAARHPLHFACFDLRLRAYHVVGDGEESKLQAVGDASLNVDIRKVALDRLFGDGELLGDVAVRTAFDDATDHLEFAGSQSVGFARERQLAV
jgi:hypothetical protein